VTNDEILAEIERLIEADRFDEANMLADELRPTPWEEIEAILRDAPLDDEPVSATQRAAMARADEAMARSFGEKRELRAG